MDKYENRGDNKQKPGRSLMSIASARAEREERERVEREKSSKNPLLDAAIAGGMAYLTGGIGNALLGAVAPAIGAIPGVGAALKAVVPATQAATAATATPAASGGIMDVLRSGAGTVGEALKPSRENLLGALKAGVRGYGAGGPGEAAGVGLAGGVGMIDAGEQARMAEQKRQIEEARLSKSPEHILKLGKMKTDILKYAEPLTGTLDPGEELPNDVFELEGVLPGVKYFKYRKQPNYIQQFIQGGGVE
jgi:hypothetical protein